MAKLLSLKLDHVCERPKEPEGFTFVTATVSTGGEGLFLFIGSDRAGEVRATEKIGIGIFPKPRMQKAKAFKLCIVANGETLWVDIPPTDISHPHVELFPDGRILLAGARCAWRGPEDFDRNGAIFDPQTGRVDRILLGDGIEDIAVDEVGRIWVSYFDEGVFGNFGWGHPGPEGPGSGGLVCFDATGAILWRFNRDDGVSFIDDCYAMHASRRLVSVFFYSAFEVCEVDLHFAQSFYKPTQIAGSHALVASKAAFLFSGEYQEAKNVMHLVLRSENGLEKPKRVVFELPDEREIAGRLVGRGENLHLLNEQGWFRAGLSDFVAAAS
jgi:hypothetical protein